ncbi:hypothetical protein [Rathayibacter rathayi]|uniref:hypothetical protein n=1 Tax=Rathayibacter rathayi TaxID=33887 RepID=UPI000CE7E61E|nr:hypothetical protein [Rathayibacter rathayi]PPH29273.1 hypothetical protein C5C28_14945 [Rathayibacter rathayi]
MENLIQTFTFFGLAAVFLARIGSAWRVPESRLSWLASGIGALAVFTLGGVVPISLLDGELGGTNLLYLIQDLLTTMAFWLIVQATLSRGSAGGLRSRSWWPLLFVAIAFTIPFWFIERNATSKTFTHDQIAQLATLLCVGLYLGGLIYFSAQLIRGVISRPLRVYWPFLVGSVLVILACFAEGTFNALDYFDIVSADALFVGYKLFTPLFFPGVLFIISGIASFTLRRVARDRKAAQYEKKLVRILAKRGSWVGALGDKSNDENAKLRRVYFLTTAIRDREVFQQLEFSKREKRIVDAAARFVKKNLAIPNNEAYAKLVFCRVKKMSPRTALKASRKVRSGRR